MQLAASANIAAEDGVIARVNRERISRPIPMYAREVPASGQSTQEPRSGGNRRPKPRYSEHVTGVVLRAAPICPKVIWVRGETAQRDCRVFVDRLTVCVR